MNLALPEPARQERQDARPDSCAIASAASSATAMICACAAAQLPRAAKNGELGRAGRASSRQDKGPGLGANGNRIAFSIEQVIPRKEIPLRFRSHADQILERRQPGP
jgi:hypothetical protein